MVSAANNDISLQSELESKIKAIHRGEKLRCFHTINDGKQCGNTLKKATLTKLAALFEEIIANFEDGSKDLTVLLKEASLLAMCVRRHQVEATAKFEKWSVKISAGNCNKATNGIDEDNPLSMFTPKWSKKVHPAGSFTEKRLNASPSVIDLHHVEENLTPEIAKLSLDSSFIDSGYKSSDKESFFQEYDIGMISKVTETAALSTSAQDSAPQTPQKTTKPTPTDSGISLSLDTSDGPGKQYMSYQEESESPLAGKEIQARKIDPRSLCSRPAPTPIQPTFLPSRPNKNFQPYDDPAAKLRNYIKTPFKKKRKGYVYGFQIPDNSYTKIGFWAEPDTKQGKEPTVKASSSKKRIDQHRRSGRPDLKLVFDIAVLQPQRVEKIVHYHLGVGRKKERCTCVSRTGRRIYHGEFHNEWFDTPLDEIKTIVEAWSHWMLTMPYANISNEMHHLTPDWTKTLEYTKIPTTGDIWLKYLCKHVPAMPERIKKISMDVGEWDKEEKTTKGQEFIIRQSLSGVKTVMKRAYTVL